MLVADHSREAFYHNHLSFLSYIGKVPGFLGGAIGDIGKERRCYCMLL